MLDNSGGYLAPTVGDDVEIAQGDHVTEVRFNFGPGYRVYLTQEGDKLVLLLVGGDKSSQHRDIKKAKELAMEWRQAHENQ